MATLSKAPPRRARLTWCGSPELVDERALGAVDLAEVLAGGAVAAAGGGLGALEDARGPGLELGHATHPVVDVGGLAPALGMDLLQAGHHARDGADEEMAEVEAMREHVAELARAGEGRGLPPAQRPRVPQSCRRLARRCRTRPAKPSSTRCFR